MICSFGISFSVNRVSKKCNFQIISSFPCHSISSSSIDWNQYEILKRHPWINFFPPRLSHQENKTKVSGAEKCRRVRCSLTGRSLPFRKDPQHLHSPLNPRLFIPSLLSISKLLLRASGGTITERRDFSENVRSLKREKSRRKTEGEGGHREDGISITPLTDTSILKWCVFFFHRFI